ncbi:MAG: UPF0280 family protein [Spirochaetaceae bacterium]|nr:UPF0280 family protein [Spirochaetaceae bacterium]
MQGVPHRGRELRERFYRASMGTRVRSWVLRVKESDLWIGVDPVSWRPEMEEVARAALLNARRQIEGYAGPALGSDWGQGSDLPFLTSLEPLPDDPAAPPVVRAMLRAGIAAGVGPMAAVAGAVAEHVGRTLRTAFSCKEIIIENGGDLWLAFERPLTISVYAGDSPLSGILAIELDPRHSPCGLCTSSGTVGPSLSFGYADAAVILCRDAATADAWATAACNRIQTAEDISLTLAFLKTHPEVLACLIVVGDKVGMQGAFRIKPVGRPSTERPPASRPSAARS